MELASTDRADAVPDAESNEKSALEGRMQRVNTLFDCSTALQEIVNVSKVALGSLPKVEAFRLFFSRLRTVATMEFGLSSVERTRDRPFKKSKKKGRPDGARNPHLLLSNQLDGIGLLLVELTETIVDSDDRSLVVKEMFSWVKAFKTKNNI